MGKKEGLFAVPPALAGFSFFGFFWIFGIFMPLQMGDAIEKFPAVMFVFSVPCGQCL